jgi:hypothetical protein
MGILPSAHSKKTSLRRPIRFADRCPGYARMLIMASCMEATESYKPVTSVRLGGICAEA